MSSCRLGLYAEGGGFYARGDLLHEQLKGGSVRRGGGSMLEVTCSMSSWHCSLYMRTSSSTCACVRCCASSSASRERISLRCDSDDSSRPPSSTRSCAEKNRENRRNKRVDISRKREERERERVDISRKRKKERKKREERNREIEKNKRVDRDTSKTSYMGRMRCVTCDKTECEERRICRRRSS